MFADLARDIANNLPSYPDWRIEVIEPAVGTVFGLGILARTRHSLHSVLMDVKDDCVTDRAPTSGVPNACLSATG